MVNVLIPINENYQEYSRLISEISFYNDINIIVGITEDLEKNVIKDENVKYLVFKNGSNKEEILNAMSKFVLAGKILILRKSISKKDFNKIIATNEKIVITKSKPTNKFVSFFKKIWHKIVKLFFGVAFYEGNTSVIMFDDDLSEVLLQTGNISYNSRVNRWRGIDETAVDIEDKKTVKFPVDKKQNITFSITIACLIAFVALASTLICLFVNLTFILGLFLACVDIICIFVALLLLLMLLFNNKVGEKNIKEAVLIENWFYDESASSALA